MTLDDLKQVDPEAEPEPSSNPVRRLSDGMNRVVGWMEAPEELLNETFAKATANLAHFLPAIPAATLGIWQRGIHAHAHLPFVTLPGSVPMPSMGPILFGGSMTVLIGGLPAARSGDLGLAPTCGGFSPFFEVFTGSSHVFIGGARAARVLDLTRVCMPGAGAAKGIRAALSVVTEGIEDFGMAADFVSNLADATDTIFESDPAVAKGLALSATTGTAQLAADVVRDAMESLMGLDPAVPPIPGLISFGMPSVCIGGFPMPGWGELAKGLMRLGKGLKKRKGGKQGRGKKGKNH